MMEKFYIITNVSKDPYMKVTSRIQNYLQSRGKKSVLCINDKEGRIVPDTIPKKVDMAIVIGGDGTLIRAARDLFGRKIPLLGVNMGTLGYLTEVELGDIEDAIDQIVDGSYCLEPRMMLEGLFKEGQKENALNDIVVSRSGPIRIVNFHIYVNGTYLNSYQADGIIVSTPTGSTAYNLSAGGPVVEPTAELIVITPICPHSLNSRSIILDPKDTIEIELGKSHGIHTEAAEIAFDGECIQKLYTGESFDIRRARETTTLIKLSKAGFLEILGKKMKGN